MSQRPAGSQGVPDVSRETAAMIKRLRVEDPKDFGNVWVATSKDPEGNLLQLLQFHH